MLATSPKRAMWRTQSLLGFPLAGNFARYLAKNAAAPDEGSASATSAIARASASLSVCFPTNAKLSASSN
jgi:hypothetical protein